MTRKYHLALIEREHLTAVLDYLLERCLIATVIPAGDGFVTVQVECTLNEQIAASRWVQENFFGYARVRWVFKTKSKQEALRAMVAYGWSYPEAEYAYRQWTAEVEAAHPVPQ